MLDKVPVMETYIDTDGYKRKQIKHSDLVHRKVAYHDIFLKNKGNYSLPFSKYVVHHIDRNKLNNDISNLIIVTKEDHQKLHGLVKKMVTEKDTKKWSLEKAKDRHPNASINNTNANDLLNLLKKNRQELERNKERTIRISRIQVEINNPAIAQVVVEFPDSLKNEINKFFTHFYDKYNRRSIVYKFVRIENGCIVEIRSNMKMYTWFEVLIVDYCSYFDKKFTEYIVKISGTWSNYNP